MAKKEVTVCDTIECKTLAEFTCAICKKDSCSTHADAQLDLGITVKRRKSETVTATIRVQTALCNECQILMHALATAADHGGWSDEQKAVLRPIRDALLERFRPMLPTIVAELTAARAADTLVKTR